MLFQFSIGMKKELIVEYKNRLQEVNYQNLPAPPAPSDGPTTSSRCVVVEQSIPSHEREALLPLPLLVSTPLPPPPKQHSINLPRYEKQRLMEIKSAMSREFADDRKLTVVGMVTVMNDGFNLAGYYVKNICKFCKHIPEFNCLPVADQVLIMKSAFFDVCVLRFAFTYDSNIDGIPMAANADHDRVVIFPLQLLGHWKKEDVVSVFRKFHSTASKEMENDTNIRDLLIVQCIFNKSDTSCPEFMRYQYHAYSRLLKMYLAQKYRNEAKMEQKYSSLMTLIHNEGERLRQIIEEIYASMPISEIQPVLAELYGLV